MQSPPAVVTRVSARRRRTIAVWSLLALLFSQWAMAFHLCVPGERAASPGNSEVRSDCHGARHDSVETEADLAPVNATGCVLHCAQPDQSPTTGKVTTPAAIPASDFVIASASIALGQVSATPLGHEAPPRTARRRLIERGALLI